MGIHEFDQHVAGVLKKRIDGLWEFDIVAEPGNYIGAVHLSAGEADKVLRLLRRLRKLEAKK